MLLEPSYGKKQTNFSANPTQRQALPFYNKGQEIKFEMNEFKFISPLTSLIDCAGHEAFAVFPAS